MLQSVLIVEDHESTGISVRKTIEEMGIPQAKYVSYCDEALAWLKRSVHQEQPYDLLITDLSFEDDGYPQTLHDGAALIEAARKLQPDLKVIVFSAGQEPAAVERLFRQLSINGYVRKARRDAVELKTAIEKTARGELHYPTFLRGHKQENTYQFSEFEVTLVRLLAQGVRQKDIPEHLERLRLRPSGLSSVEKRLNTLRDVLGCSKNEQLVAICKDWKVI